VYFVADDGIHGDAIWRYTPAGEEGRAAECALVVDLDPGQASAEPHGFFSAGQYLYFTAKGAYNQRQPFLLGEKDQPMVVKNGEGERIIEPYFQAKNPEYLYVTATAVPDNRWLYRLHPGDVTTENLALVGRGTSGIASRRGVMGNDGFFLLLFRSLSLSHFRKAGHPVGRISINRRLRLDRRHGAPG
jgi:ELWxxDGT repeat protein